MKDVRKGQVRQFSLQATRNEALSRKSKQTHTPKCMSLVA